MPNEQPGDKGFGRSLLSGLTSALPVVGSIGAAALQRHWALKDLQRQNIYNSPKEQIKRLKEAGLPLATMFGGQGGSTSEQPQNTNVDPSLGVAKGLDNFFTNRMQSKQLELLDAQIRSQNADASVKEGEAKWLGQTAISGATNQEDILIAKRDQAQFESIIKGNEQILSNQATAIESELYSSGKLTQNRLNQIEELVKRLAGMQQNQNINAPMETFARRIANGMGQKGFQGDIKAALYGLLRAIIGLGK